MNKLILNKLDFIEIYPKHNTLFFIYRLLNKLTSGVINKKILTLYDKF